MKITKTDLTNLIRDELENFKIVKLSKDEMEQLHKTGQMEKDGVFLRQMKDDLLHLIDEDAKAFDQVMKAYSLPKKTDIDKKIRDQAIEKAYMDAVTTPMLILKKSSGILYTISKIYKNINPNCISDLGVAIELASASANGAIMNIKINLCEIKSKSYKNKMNKEIEDISSANDLVTFETLFCISGLDL